jgi:hypothetical protein
LQRKYKLATGNSVSSSQTTTVMSKERKPPQRNDENVICLPLKKNTLQILEASHGYVWLGWTFSLTKSVYDFQAIIIIIIIII